MWQQGGPPASEALKRPLKSLKKQKGQQNPCGDEKNRTKSKRERQDYIYATFKPCKHNTTHTAELYEHTQPTHPPLHRCFDLFQRNKFQKLDAKKYIRTLLAALRKGALRCTCNGSSSSCCCSQLPQAHRAAAQCSLLSYNTKEPAILRIWTFKYVLLFLF